METRTNESKEAIRQKRRAMQRLKQMNQEQLAEALKKKKECNVKAKNIVEKLLDPVEDPKELPVLLRDINQSHYQDIVEERAITHVCGYPLCNEKLVDIPKKQYTISLVHKKVFDITERKNFCSGKCFKASNYIKSQLLTSPLWLRETEIIPEFKLLSLD